MVMTIEGLGRQGFSQKHDPRQQRRRKAPAPKPREISEDIVRTAPLRNEQVRAEFGAINRSIREAEDALAIVAEADGGLARIQSVLIILRDGLDALAREDSSPSARGESPPSAQGESPPLPPQPEASDAEASNSEASNAGVSQGGDRTREAWLAKCLAELDAIATQTRFGERHLLDGSLGCAGMALGDGLTFVAADEETRSSPAEGYEVMLTREPTRATLLGDRPLDEEMVAQEVRLILTSGEIDTDGIVTDGTPYQGPVAEISTHAGQSPPSVADALQQAVSEAGLPLIVDAAPDGRLLVQHRRFGAAHRFTAYSSLPGVLSGLDGSPRLVANGRDISGTLNDEPAEGRGQTLIGAPGNPATAGLVVRYTGLPYTGANTRLPRSRPAILEPRVFAGRIILARQALAFRLETGRGGTVFLGLDSVRPSQLGREGAGSGRYHSLEGIEVGDPEAIADSQLLLERVRRDIAHRRRRLIELTHERIKPILARLRDRAENHFAGVRWGSTPEGPGNESYSINQKTGDTMKHRQRAGQPTIERQSVSIGRDVSHAELDQVRLLSQWIRHEGGHALSAHTKPSQNTLLELLHDDDETKASRPGLSLVR